MNDRRNTEETRDSSKTLVLSAVVARQMITQAAASPEREICGLLYGRKVRMKSFGQQFIPIPNRAEAADRFLMDPEALIRTLFHMQKSHPDSELLAIIHSHPSPTAAPVPSLADLRGHWSKQVFSVILFRKNQQWQIAAYQLADNLLSWKNVDVLIEDWYNGM